jgi:hypothetical protein
VSDPQGHSFGAHPAPAERFDPDQWPLCRAYLYGVDLFNHGYYWEAHEAWEALWHACGRTGSTGWFLKGLIKLAAAGVKADDARFMGLRLAELIRFAGEVANRTLAVNRNAQVPLEVVFDFTLWPA